MDRVALTVKSALERDAGSARRKLLGWQLRSGQRAGPYRDLIGSLPDHALPDHGILTLGLRAGGELELRVGLSGVALAEQLAACGLPQRGPRSPSAAWPVGAASPPVPLAASPAPDVHAPEFASLEMLREFDSATSTWEDAHV